LATPTTPGVTPNRLLAYATRLLTGKVWPELGELLEGDEE